MEKNKEEKIKVIFILGSGHCGSTPLDMMLGSNSQMVGTGELHVNFPEMLCACGKEVKNCPFWMEVYKNLSISREEIFLPKNTLLKNIFSPVKNIYYTKTNALVDFKKFQDDFHNLALNILNISSKKILVDSSKSPERAFIISLDPRFEVKIIHLVRDVRGVTWSYLRKYGFSFAHFTKWFMQNLKIEFFKSKTNAPYLFVNFKNLTTNSKVELQKICKFIGVSYEDKMLNFRENENHQVGGNRMKFKTEIIVQPNSRKVGMPIIYQILCILCFGWLDIWYKFKK